MPNKAQNLANSLLFWFHLVLILSSIGAGFFLTPWLVVILVLVHRVHVMFFQECLLTKLQRRLGGLPPGTNFLQLASEKIFQKNITARQSFALEYFFSSLAMIISVAK